jgi:hypothetical protein
MERLGAGLAAWSRRWIPDPYIFTILLTLFTVVLGIVFARQGSSTPIGRSKRIITSTPSRGGPTSTAASPPATLSARSTRVNYKARPWP